MILGAGASYDSDPDTPAVKAAQSRPPLAKELFDRGRFGHFVAEWKECQPLIHDLRLAARRGELEQQLEVFRDEAEGAEHIRRAVDAIPYYLRSVVDSECASWNESLNGVTTYQGFIRRLESWRAARNERIAVITFNYDTLLEQALTSVFPSRTFGRMRDYAEHGFDLIKPHGSTNWWHPIKIPPERYRERAEVIERLGTPEGVAHLVIATPKDFDVQERILTGAELFEMGNWQWRTPALAIPTVTKSVFQCPTEQLNEMDVALVSMTKLLVIGWRGMENYFISRWKQSGSPSLRLWQVCSTENGAGVTEVNLHPVIGDRPQVEAATGGFSEYVYGGGLERFLSAGV